MLELYKVNADDIHVLEPTIIKAGNLREMRKKISTEIIAEGIYKIVSVKDTIEIKSIQENVITSLQAEKEIPNPERTEETEIVKPKRHRRTNAEIQAAREAEALAKNPVPPSQNPTETPPPNEDPNRSAGEGSMQAIKDMLTMLGVTGEYARLQKASQAAGIEGEPKISFDPGKWTYAEAKKAFQVLKAQLPE